MDPLDLKLPTRGFTKAERKWLTEELIPALKTVYGIAGANATISNTDTGQVISASDCTACP